MKVISNTTPIISQASIGKLDILKELFNEIIIAETVYNEIKAKKRLFLTHNSKVKVSKKKPCPPYMATWLKMVHDIPS